MSNDYTQILTKGLQSALGTQEIEDGVLRFTTDTGRLYLDNGTSERIPISNVVTGMTEQQIINLQNPLDKLYVSSDTLKVFASDGTNMRDISEIIPVHTSANETMYLWMGDSSGNGPKYASALNYNPSTKDIQIGNMRVSKTEDSGTNVLDFYVV